MNKPEQIKNIIWYSLCMTSFKILVVCGIVLFVLNHFFM